MDAQLPALDHARHGGRHPLRRHARRRTVVGARTTTRATSSPNGFIDEFKLAQWPTFGPTTPPAAAARAASPTSGRHGHEPAADLPRVHQRAAATRTIPARLHRHDVDEHRPHAGHGVPQPVPGQLGGRPRRRRDAAHERDRGRPPGELLRRQPGGRRRTTSPTAARSATTTRCRSTCGAGCRRASRRASTTSTRSRAARRSSASRYGRVMNPSTNVRHAIKTQWDWTLPVGRGQRFGTDMHPVLDGILGGWSFNGVGRIQAVDGQLRQRPPRRHDAEGRCRRCTSTTSGSTRRAGSGTVYMLPDDVILNTRRAFSVSPTTAERLQHGARRARRPVHRAGQQRELHPAQAGRLRAADAPDPRAVVHALRRRRHQAVHPQGPHQHRSARSTC